MAVAHDVSTQSLDWATATAQTVTHTPSGTPRGALVRIVQSGGADQVSIVTYGGVPMGRVRSDARTSTEQGRVYLYFLGADVPTGAQTVSVTSTGTNAKRFVVSTVTAAQDTAVDVSNGGDAGIIANPSLTLDYTDGLASWVAYYCTFSGLAAPVTTVQAGGTHEFGHDYGSQAAMWSRKTGAAGTSTTMGYTASSDDICHAGAVVAEAVPAAVSQARFRFRDDSAAVNTDAGWFAATNTNPAATDIAPEQDFRLRFGLDATGAENRQYKLQARRKPFGGAFAGWTDVNVEPGTLGAAATYTPICIHPMSNVTDGEAITAALLGGAGTFVNGSAEEGGLTQTNLTAAINLASGNRTEVEFGVRIHKWSDGRVFVAEGDEFEFRLVTSSGALLTYTVTPKVTVARGDGVLGGTWIEGPARIGPAADGNGNLYALFEYTETQPRLCIAKSTDGGVYWVDGTTVGRSDLADMEAVDVRTSTAGDVLHILLQGVSNDDVYYFRYHTSSHATTPDTWAIIDELVVAGPDPIEQSVSLEVRADGTLVAFYTSLKTQDHVCYKIRSSGGVWGAETVIDSGDGVGYAQCASVADSTGLIYLFYKSTAGIFYRTLSTGDVLSARTQIVTDDFSSLADRMPLQPPVHYLAGADEVVTLAWGTNNNTPIDQFRTIQIINGAVQASQQASDRAVNKNKGQSRMTIGHLAVDGTTLHLVYADAATEDMWHTSRVHGGTWAASTEIGDGLTCHWININVLTHAAGNGGAKVVGVVFDDGSAGFTGFGRYREHVLTAGGAPVVINSAAASMTASAEPVTPTPATLAVAAEAASVATEAQAVTPVVAGGGGTEFLYATSHLAGTFTNPDNAVGNTPATWAGDLNTSGSATSRWAIGDPVDPLTAAATQTVRVVARKGANSGVPTIALNLYEGGVLVQALLAATDITAREDLGETQTLVGTFDSSAVTDRAAVEVEVAMTAVGGNPSTRNSAQISLIEWEAATTAGGGGAPVDVPSAAAVMASSAEAVTPTPAALAIPVTAATLASEAQAVTATPAALAVPVSAASVAVQAQAVTPAVGGAPVAIASAAAAMAASAQAVTPALAALVVPASAAAVTAAAQAVTPAPAPKVVQVTAASMATAAQTVTVVRAALAIASAAASAATAAQPVTVVLAPKATQVTAASMAVTAQVVTPVVAGAPVAVAVTPAVMATAAQAVTPVRAAVVVTVIPGVLGVSAQPVAIVVSPLAVGAAPATLQVIAQAVSVELPGLIAFGVDTRGATTPSKEARGRTLVGVDAR